MPEQTIYEDIAQRTDGNIYIGVVGPVRTGKSTFIKRFMENLVIPAIADESERTRAQDELPQSAGGRTVMTTEPKFIPDDAVEIRIGGGNGNASMRVRMIDCVGYIVPGAIGNYENDAPRMVHTPWSDAPMAFDAAAELGTHKVICEHSTIGILVTTDGTVGELPREAYLDAEKRVVSELQAQGKPFVIVLNSAHPESQEAAALGLQMENAYHAPVALVSCMEMDGEDIRHIMELVLNEFPIREVGLRCPRWLNALPAGHWLSRSIYDTVSTLAKDVRKMGEVQAVFSSAADNEYIEGIRMDTISPGIGTAVMELQLDDSLFFRIIEEETGFSVTSDAGLLELLRSLTAIKKKYDHVQGALQDVYERGYGVVMPDIEELKLEEPEIVKQNAGYGVRLKASAPSVHMIRANIEAEVSPIVGTEQQSEEMVKFLLHEFEEDPARLWETNMFGKSLHDLVGEGLHNKLAHMPEDARMKIAETVERIINEGSGGLICILL